MGVHMTDTLTLTAPPANHLDTLRGVIQFQADNAREYIADWHGTETPATEVEANLRELEGWIVRLSPSTVTLTRAEVDALRPWVDEHLNEFVAYWVADYPEDQSYRAMHRACTALREALR